jgi:hypothetical protein
MSIGNPFLIVAARENRGERVHFSGYVPAAINLSALSSVEHWKRNRKPLLTLRLPVTVFPLASIR